MLVDTHETKQIHKHDILKKFLDYKMNTK